MSKPTATVSRVSTEFEGMRWCVAFDLTGCPYERSWEWFKTREQARKRRRTALRKYQAWTKRLNRALAPAKEKP